MAEYCPPTEDVPIFNNAYFVEGDYTSGTNHCTFLQFPIAQGDETLQGITVNGLSNFLSKATFQGAEFNSTTDLKSTTNISGTLNVTNSTTFTNFPNITNYMATPSSNQLISKYYADNTYTGAGILPLNNFWTGINYYNSYIPQSILTPFNQYDFTNKQYVDNSFTNLLSSNNTWTGTNDFNKGIARCGNNDYTQVNIGSGALSNFMNNDSVNTAIGINSMNNLTNGVGNIGVGYNSGITMQTGCSNNINIGTGSGAALITNSAHNISISSSMGSSTGSGNNINNNIAIGLSSLGYVNDNCSNNTAIGQYAMYNDSGTGFSGSYCTGIGPNAGVRLGVSSTNCCFIGGCNTQPSNVSPTFSSFNYTTTIGVDAVATSSNQIVLGRSAETTVIPGQLNVNGITYNKSVLGINTSPYNITEAQTGTYFTFNRGTIGTLNLPNPTTPGLDYTFYNYGGARYNVVPGTGTFSQTNNTNVNIYLWPTDVLRVRSDGTQWQVLGTLWDCFRLSKVNYMPSPVNLVLGAQSAQYYYPFAIQGTVINSNITLSIPLYNGYVIQSTVDRAITLPVINSNMFGAKIVFRKIGGTAALTHTITPGGTNNIYPFNSNTAVTGAVTLLSNVSTDINYMSTTLICLNANSWMLCN